MKKLYLLISAALLIAACSEKTVHVDATSPEGQIGLNKALLGNWQTVEADEHNYPGVSVYLRLHFSKDFTVTWYMFYSYPEEEIYECTPYDRMSQRDYFLESGYIYLPFYIYYLNYEIEAATFRTV